MGKEIRKGKGNGVKWAILIVLILMAAITNPDKEDFKDYLSQQLSEEVDGDNWLTILLGDSVIDLLVENSVIEKDYVILTTYELDFAGETATYVGLFNNFIKIN